MPNLEHVSPVMSQCATLDGLRQNPFRIFGLRVDLTSKELSEAIKDLSMQMEFGAELPHAFALGKVDPSMLAQANQRLRDPVQRLCDECFWFWPMDMGQQDVALDLIANGDKDGAKAAWRDFLGHPEWGPIASHNIAILDLYESYDDSTGLERFGSSAKDFLSSSACVNRIKARLRTIDDPRLPRNSSPAILKELRHAMAANQVRIGLERIAQGDSVRGHRNIRCARNIADNEELLGSIAEEELASDLSRLEIKNSINVETATESAWKTLAQEALKIIERMQPFPSLTGRSQILGNNAARVLRLISVHTYNEKKNRKKSLEIAELALKLACGEVLQKINDDIRTVKDGIEAEKSEAAFDPIHNRVKKLSNSRDCNIVANEARAILGLINSALKAGHSKERADVVYHNLGWALRSMAIDAFNVRNDMSTARLFIHLAQEVVGDSEKRGLRQAELKSKLYEDSAALDRNAVASGQSGGSCLLPFVAILCLTGAATYAAPAAMHNVQNWIKILLP